MNDFFRRPLGLVLAGGASHGSWQTAAVHELTTRLGVSFDAVLGISAGALTGTGYFLNRLDEALDRWRDAEKNRMLRLSLRFFPLTFFSAEPLWEAVVSARDDEHAKNTGRCRLVIVSTCRTERKPIYAVFAPGAGGRWDGPLARHLVASCAIPRIFPPVQADYQGKNLTLVDGGVPGREPLSFAELSDCRDVIVVEMVRPDDVGRNRNNWDSRFEQSSPETSRRLMDQGIASLRGAKERRRIFRLHPSKPLEFSMLSFKAADMEDGLRRGAEDARAFMADPLSAQV